MASRRTVPRSTAAKTAPTHERARSASIRPPPPPKATPSHNAIISSATTSLPSQSQGSREQSGSNIQVVIRCRGRSEREIQENSSIIVTSDGAKSKDISIETDAAQSTLGVVTPPSTRTYPFDLVFGPEADQAMIYHEVVSPMLDEVLLGYNCTLFAYGQTGTGKTYTMHGDLKPTPMGNPSSDAGMIPRVLFRLFHSLEKSTVDYSVKLSYIELYNEELRDLFANELAPPSGSTQPMGMGNRAATDGLKIFDDANKKGVFIQGLEEIAVKDCKDALNLLTKGSERRQIAATRFNDHSSRSHSILSITVHVKETSSIGDDLLRIGKLNLVDLAGSENIGRSGAENKRAREAGMINQSLLTLGRVINALVDSAQHVPYRESKLTRLLQDSLGGRTKTCIIATVSPARSNLEETLSTLDYALRAKSIRNKPEVNQRMTRNGLLKEYIAEIERLKDDLLAAREKNGIYFSEESWNQLNSEQEMQKTQLHESRKHIEIIESQMRQVREEFEQSIGLLLKRDKELKEVKGKLEKTEIALVNVEGELNKKKVALDEEVVVRRAHQDTEKKLSIVAEDLKNVTAQTLQDIGGLFEKLERKSNILDLNTQTVAQCEQTISSLMQVISKRLNELQRSTTETATNLQTVAKDTETTELQRLSSLTQTVTEQLTLVRNALDTIHTSDQNETGALQSAQDILNEMQTTFKEEFLTWGRNLSDTYSKMCDDLKISSHKEFSTVEKALGGVYSILEKVLREVQEYIKNELALVQQVRAVVEKAAQEEIQHLRQQNDALVQMLKNEKVKADIAKETILHRMSEMLDVFTDEQNSRLQESVEDLRDQNMQAEGTLETFLQQHEAMQNQAVASGSSMSASLEKQTGVAKRTRDGAIKTLGQTKAVVQKTMHAMRDQVLDSVSSHTEWVEQQTTSYADVSTQAWKQHSRAKRARLNATDALGKDLPIYYGQLQEGLASSSKCLENTLGSIATQAGTLSETVSTYHSHLQDDLDTLESTNQRLAEHGTRPDVPTGLTPQKKRWDYVDHWDLTRSRESILDTWRRDGKPKRRSTIAPERIPLPEDEEAEEAEALEDMEDKEDEELIHKVFAEAPVPVPTPILPRSPTPTSSLSGSGSTMPTPQDSPDSLFSSISSTVQTSIPGPIRPKKVAPRTSSIVPPAASLVNPRRKNIITSRPRRTNAR